jgi:ribosomal subunit interface protein
VYHRKIVIGYLCPGALISGKKGGVVPMDLTALNFEVTDAIERHVERRVRAAVGRASRSITGTVVRLRDVNGPRGGIDKACRVVAWLRGRGTVVAEAVDRNLYAAIDAAAAKFGKALRRHVRKRRTLRRPHARRRVARVARVAQVSA